MNASTITIVSFLLLLIAYRFYGGFLRKRIFQINDNKKSPAVEKNDGVEYVPTNRWILFGHQFASIAGLGPIVGPAIAVIWGWAPALLWVVLGSIFIGGVHDFGSLAASLNHQGRGIGDITEEIVGKRAKNLFLIIIFFLLALAMGVFAILIAGLFGKFHEVIVPVFGLIAVAMIFGTALKKMGVPLVPASIVGVGLNLGLILIGIKNPVEWGTSEQWITILLVYAMLASVLPVWLLLTPRDYLNSYKLYVFLGAITLGLFFGNQDFQMVAPAIQPVVEGAPSIFPFLFITVACGAISGFHCLVSSGTTVRQLEKRTDSQMLGYGAMLLEGAFAILVIIACTSGVGEDFWNKNYMVWNSIEGGALSSFIVGGGNMIAGLGLDVTFSQTFVAVVTIAFAMTTLDSATRLLRYNVEEIGKSFNLSKLQNKYTAGFFAIVSIAFFAFMKIGGKPAGLTLWSLFGTTNQLLGGLALLVITVWLAKTKKPTWLTYWPMMFLFSMTIWAMVINLNTFYTEKQWEPFSVGLGIFILAILIIQESFQVLKKKKVS
ncbi:carbon starvation protein A [bacterium]|nr:carbon starvation protein A [bacterium]